MEGGGSNIGISILSLPGDLFEVARYLRDRGLGLQLTPTRGLTKAALIRLRNEFPGMVLSYEGPWEKDTSFRGAYQSFMKVWDLKKRPLGDPLAFVGPIIFGPDALAKVLWFKELFPGAVGINFDETGAREISPKRSMTAEEYIEHGNVCLDTLHIGEEPLIDTDIIGFIKRLVEAGCIRVVQIQTRSWSELRDFAEGRHTVIQDRLAALGHALSTVPIIMEFFPHHMVWGGILYGGISNFLLLLKRRIEECRPRSL